MEGEHDTSSRESSDSSDSDDHNPTQPQDNHTSCGDGQTTRHEAYEYNAGMRFSSHFILYVCLLCILAFIVKRAVRSCARRRRHPLHLQHGQGGRGGALLWHASNAPAAKTKPREVLPFEALLHPAEWAKEWFRFDARPVGGGRRRGEREGVQLVYDTVSREYMTTTTSSTGTKSTNRHSPALFQGSIPFCYDRQPDHQDDDEDETLLYFEVTILSMPHAEEGEKLEWMDVAIGMTSTPYPRACHVGTAAFSAAFHILTSTLHIHAHSHTSIPLSLPFPTFPLTIGIGLKPAQWQLILTLNGSLIHTQPLHLPQDVELVPAMSVDDGDWVWNVNVGGTYGWKGADGSSVIAEGLSQAETGHEDVELPGYVP